MVNYMLSEQRESADFVADQLFGFVWRGNRIGITDFIKILQYLLLWICRLPHVFRNLHSLTPKN